MKDPQMTQIYADVPEDWIAFLRTNLRKSATSADETIFVRNKR